MVVDSAACLCLLLFWCQGRWANKGVSLRSRASDNAQRAVTTIQGEEDGSRKVVGDVRLSCTCSCL